jgi:hypothetical protein
MCTNNNQQKMLLVPLLFLDPSDAGCFLGRWRPQLVAEQIVSVSGVNSYARARINLRHPDCVGMLTNVDNVAYIIHRTNQTYEIVCCLWPSGSPTLQAFRDLREWCICTIPDIEFNAERLDDTTERNLWELSVFES